jgi:hypothetical protein
MSQYKDREHFIPLRKQELIDLLCGDATLTPQEAEGFRQFGGLVSAIYHFEFNQKLERLKAAYAPFDPDADTRPLVRLTAEEKRSRLNLLFRDFAWLMERANFKHLCTEDIGPYLNTASDWGIRMDVDFSCFERLAIFARGNVVQKRTRRRLRNLYRVESTTVPVFQRLVLILKLRPHRRLSTDVDTESVYLKIFKDIPKLDLNMLLPGARVLMTYLDRSQISFPLLTGFGMIAYKVLLPVIGLARWVGGALFDAGGSPSLAFWGLAGGALGYGYRSYYGYQQTRLRYRYTLTQSLYYQNLDNNAGVLHRLMDEAEEQECREALLAYFFLWRQAGERGMTSAALDDHIEAYLERHAGLKVDFEIGDALAKLEKLRVVEKAGDRYQARPLGRALELLDWTWDNYFRYNKQATVADGPAVSGGSGRG